MVRGWTWEAVALQYAALVSRGSPTPAPLGMDPFLGVRFREPVASWRGATLRLLSGHERSLTEGARPAGFRGGLIYALYVDNDIQVGM